MKKEESKVVNETAELINEVCDLIKFTKPSTFFWTFVLIIYHVGLYFNENYYILAISQVIILVILIMKHEHNQKSIGNNYDPDQSMLALSYVNILIILIFIGYFLYTLCISFNSWFDNFFKKKK